MKEIGLNPLIFTGFSTPRLLNFCACGSYTAPPRTLTFNNIYDNQDAKKFRLDFIMSGSKQPLYKNRLNGQTSPGVIYF
jgi:hypothetical protein